MILVSASYTLLHFAENSLGLCFMHYELKYLYVHKFQANCVLKVLKTETALQLANICTKQCTWSVT